MTNGDDKLTKLSEVLIGKVCSYQCLYNPANLSYKSKRHKNLCWIKIGLECNLDASVAKSKWKSLRDRYVRERKAEKIAEHCGTAAPRKEWALYKYLSFLDPFLSTLEIQSTMLEQDKSRPVKRERDESPSEDSSAVVEDECVGHFLDMHSYSKPAPVAKPLAPQRQSLLLASPPMLQASHSTQQPYVYILPAPAADPPSTHGPGASPNSQTGSVSKKAKASIADRATKNPSTSHLEKRFTKYVNQHGLENAEEYSSDEMFVLSLVPSFNKLSEARKDKLKLDMHKLVYDAVYGSN